MPFNKHSLKIPTAKYCKCFFLLPLVTICTTAWISENQCSDLLEISDRTERMPNFIAVNSLQVERLFFSTVFHVIWHIWFPADSVDLHHHLSTASENEMISGTSELKSFYNLTLEHSLPKTSTRRGDQGH